MKTKKFAIPMFPRVAVPIVGTGSTRHNPEKPRALHAPRMIQDGAATGVYPAFKPEKQFRVSPLRPYISH